MRRRSMGADTAWEIPEPRSVLDVRHDDRSITRVRRHGVPGGRRLLVGHGNGLAVDLYYPFWSRFLHDFDVFVYDLRNHGWNAVGPQGEHNIPNLVRDQEQVVEAVFARYGRTPTIGVFHSLSALTALLSSSLGTSRTGDLAAWILYDPPLFKPRLGETEYDNKADLSADLADDGLGRLAALVDESEGCRRARPLYRRLVESYSGSGWASVAASALRRCAEREALLQDPPPGAARVDSVGGRGYR